MDILERLVKQILDDITEAQDQANKRSAKLSVQYQNGQVKNLEHYAVPNAVVKSFDFTLKFALESLGDVLTERIANELTSVVETKWLTLLNRIRKEDPQAGDAIADAEKSLPVIDYTKISIGAGENLVAVIGEVISKAFATTLKSLQVTNDIITKHITLSKTEIEAALPAVLSAIKGNEPITMPDLSAVFDISRIKGVDASAFCEIKVKVDMENLKWGYYDNDSGKGAMLTN